MTSVMRLIKRFVITLILSLMVLLVLNIVLIIAALQNDKESLGGWKTASKLTETLTMGLDGEYQLSEEGKRMLEEGNSWAVLVQDGTGDVIWHSENLPEEIQLHYSAAEISWYTRGYIADYPTTTAAMGENLIIVGNPKERYWKELYPTWNLNLIKNLPRTILIFFGANLVIVFLIYMIVVSGILRSVKPIVQGIQGLPGGEEVYVKEKGLLSDLAAALNRVSEMLRSQEYELKKKERARADWISGVSHDIRTPLSMVMGYAAEVEEETEASEEIRQKAGIIRMQSIRMKNLVNDLNLASKLEYNVQPVKTEEINLVALLRETAVYFMNLDIEGKYPVELRVDIHCISDGVFSGDKELLKRAVNNLLLNAQIHNPAGCRIWMGLSEYPKEFCVTIEDDGIGVTDEQLEKLRNTPHYMLSSGTFSEQRHGLGLLIVQQIIAVHGGRVAFGQGIEKGFRVDIFLNKRRKAIKMEGEKG
ncbi:MAG: HAMP domain-containing histidine kinase [Dorea sp.]|nr:HAMP domain-containing histidine kinase [Dorea sp.]